MRAKICGITNLEDALICISEGASALGFVFYEKSPRYISPKDTKAIIDKLPPFIERVGLFVNVDEKTINTISKEAGISLAQIIDDSNSLDFSKLDIKAIKVIRVSKKEDLEKLDNNYYLVDAFVESFGGEGKRIAIEWFDDIDCSKLILAGGLKASNLDELKGYDFYGVDVSSGVEATKGKKDPLKIKEFMKKVNEAK